jgi:hypothetical protein
MYIGEDGINMEYTWYIPGIYCKSGFQMLAVTVWRYRSQSDS